MVISSLKNGFIQAWSHKRMIVLYYLVNLFFSIILMLPFRSALDKFTGNSLIGEKLAGGLDMDFLFEFLKHGGASLSSLSGLIIFVPVFYWLIQLFLSGGALSIFAGNQEFSSQNFWGGCARYFSRFIKILLWCLPVFAVLFCLQFIWDVLERIIYGKDPYENVIYWGAWIKLGLRYVSILLIGLVFDYARIYAVMMNESKTPISVILAIKFTFLNLHKTFTLIFIIFIAGIIGLVAYNLLANLLHSPNTIVILLLFLAQQFYIFGKMILKLTAYSSQIFLYKTVTQR